MYALGWITPHLGNGPGAGVALRPRGGAISKPRWPGRQQGLLAVLASEASTQQRSLRRGKPWRAITSSGFVVPSAPMPPQLCSGLTKLDEPYVVTVVV